MPLPATFSAPSVHHSVVADDFWPSAAALRTALLDHPYWGPMRQYGRGVASAIVPDHQSGISGLDIESGETPLASEVGRLRAFILEHASELCRLVGVDAVPDEDFAIQCNAMAYGEGARLVPHTDFRDDEARPHVLAWILYLTDPADGEWDATKGGALRLIDADDCGPRVYPKFNRFAMFRVSDRSLHEVEPVLWPCPWTRCRLALSGWIRGPVDVRPRATCVYRRSATALAERAKRDAWYQGAIAMHRLLLQQEQHVHASTEDTAAKIRLYESEADANRHAPEGTVFVRMAPGPPGCIIVFDGAGQIEYFGPRSAFRA